MRLGVVVGLAAEARLARRLGGMVAIGGGTTAGARAAAERLIADGATALLSFGLAGALDPALRPGDLLVPRAVLTAGRELATDPTLAVRLGGPTDHVVLGAGAIVATAAEKATLRVRSGCAAVDLESGAVAEAAAAHGLPFAVLRAICDPAERGLPPAAVGALGAGGRIGLGRVLVSLAVHPGQLPALLALARDAQAARRALAAWAARS